MTNQHLLDTTKTYKVFLVEEDDEDRERVIRALVRSVEIKTEPEYADVHSEYSILSMHHFKTHETYTMTLELKPGPDGTVLTIENFNEEEE